RFHEVAKLLPLRLVLLIPHARELLVLEIFDHRWHRLETGREQGRNAGRPTLFVRTLRTTGARRTSFISLFSLPTRSSVCEGDDQVVADRFDSVHVQRKFRGKILRLARLKVPGAVAILAYDGDSLPVHVAVRRSEEHTSEL